MIVVNRAVVADDKFELKRKKTRHDVRTETEFGFVLPITASCGEKRGYKCGLNAKAGMDVPNSL